MSLRYLVTKAVVWFNFAALASMVTLGLFYVALLLTNTGVLLSLVEPIAYSIAVILVNLTIIFLFLSIVIGIAYVILNRRRPLPHGLVERLHRLGTEALARMQVGQNISFMIRKRYAGASLRRNKIAVGDELLLQGTDDDIIAIIGHELGHLLRKRYLFLRWLVTIIQVLSFLATIGYSEQPSLFIVAITVVYGLSFLKIPVNWRAEYSADSIAAKRLGVDNVAHSLDSLAKHAYRGRSFSHPRLATRIKRIRASEDNVVPNQAMPSRVDPLGKS